MIPYRRSFFFEPVSRRLQESEVFLKLVPSSSLWCFESTMIAAFRTRQAFSRRTDPVPKHAKQALSILFKMGSTPSAKTMTCIIESLFRLDPSNSKKTQRTEQHIF